MTKYYQTDCVDSSLVYATDGKEEVDKFYGQQTMQARSGPCSWRVEYQSLK